MLNRYGVFNVSESDTLVVDTTNFTDKTHFRGHQLLEEGRGVIGVSNLLDGLARNLNRLRPVAWRERFVRSMTNLVQVQHG